MKALYREQPAITECLRQLGDASQVPHTFFGGIFPILSVFGDAAVDLGGVIALSRSRPQICRVFVHVVLFN